MESVAVLADSAEGFKAQAFDDPREPKKDVAVAQHDASSLTSAVTVNWNRRMHGNEIAIYYPYDH